ncbi:Uncharacterized conserved protein [Streptomyces atratus]|uniref:Uncharacterized conserved protein n=1 Tax=Streptomyces atratus TaxID=1893 RepID=A0A1K2F3W8_STRAR|nr:Uncharacterized conserved protein [Streptomyces atratus]
MTLVLAGLGALALAAGIKCTLTEGVGRRAPPILVGIFGAGLIASGLFPMGDPESGFPVGTPDQPVARMSWHSVAHSASAVAAHSALAIAAIVLTVRCMLHRAVLPGRAERRHRMRTGIAHVAGLYEYPDRRERAGRLHLDDRPRAFPAPHTLTCPTIAKHDWRRDPVKYLLLGYTSAAGWDAATADAPTEEALAAFAAYQKFEKELLDSGELVTTEGLGHPAVSITVNRTPDGVTATDGPFAELKEVLASFAVIDVAGRERAVDIASRIVEVLGEPIEIRAIMGEDFTA